MRVFVATLLFIALAAGAASAAQSHTVQPGETLWSIASRYAVPVDAVARANALPDPDRLRAGQRLVIPDTSPVRTSGTWRRGSLQSRQGYRRHEVQAGDTLWSLARRYGMRVEALAALNGIAVERTLRVGQMLLVPPGGPQTAGLPLPQPPRLARPLPYRGEAWAGSLIGLARRLVGTRYRWGGSGPRGFDCSGFLYFVYSRMGVSLPRTSFGMYYAGRSVPEGDLRPGDLVFFTTTRRGPSHAGIYIGNGEFIHSSSGFGRVTITPLSYTYYRNRYLGARRF